MRQISRQHVISGWARKYDSALFKYRIQYFTFVEKTLNAADLRIQDLNLAKEQIECAAYSDLLDQVFGPLPPCFPGALPIPGIDDVCAIG